ncbi:sigma-54 interaction domain-containing protein [uncultured Flavonifractor sp.]|uniref:sigma-54 interaction domain-containing protein n=1 Tax=uncultured Flavonifractor sp. TaxID=1193534 RepID=UPI0026109CC7|nr:sigma 54-interacting transcriptional regulator [uncultured Flavonifractor sp.]
MSQGRSIAAGQAPVRTARSLPRVSQEEYRQIRKNNIRIYGYNNRLTSQLRPLMAESEMAYALFSPEGCLLKLTASPRMERRLEADGITPGTLWDAGSAGRNAVSLGLASDSGPQNRTLHTVGPENECQQLKPYAVYFSSLRVWEDDIQPDHPEHLYGGVAILVSAERQDPRLLTDIFAVANDLILHLCTGNLYARLLERSVDALLVFDISAKTGKIHTLYHSKNIFDVFEIPPRDIYFRAADLLIDPLPQNQEFWQLISDRRRVQEKSLTISVQGKKLSCIVSTEPYRQPELDVSGISILITTHQRRTASISKQISNTAVRTFDDIIGQSPAIRAAVDKARQIANSVSNVLITGESGVGKDIFAQAIHNASSRRGKPFVAVNCGALPRDLISSELFGYEGGAFTGAKRQGNIGKFELANGGTLFLDEIGELPFDLQATLLRAVEQKRIIRVGGTKEIAVDVRIISATNVNMQIMMEHKSFRSDLYYRLSTLRLQLPPLRERGSDIILLAEYFIRSVSERIHRPAPIELSATAKSLLTSLPWRGNIRELQNVFEGIVQLCRDSTIEPAHILQELGLPGDEPVPPGLVAAAGPPPHHGLLTREEILHALEQCGGNRSEAARYLGIGRRTLYNNLERLGIKLDK